MNHIKLFLEYKNVGRSSELTESEFIDMVKSNCKEWLSNPKPLVRAKSDYEYKYSYMDPKNSVRRSINKSDHITMIIDEFPSWSHFPKRKNSVIFTDNLKLNSGVFGSNLFYVIPFDGAKFGTIPSKDLWTLNNKDIPVMGLNGKLSNELLKLGAPEDYKSFIKWSNDIFSKKNLMKSEFDVGHITTRIYVEYQEYLNDGGVDDFITWFDSILSPDNWVIGDGEISGVPIVTNYSGLGNSTYPGFIGNECWTDSKCLFYYIGKDMSWKEGENYIDFSSSENREKYFDGLLSLFK